MNSIKIIISFFTRINVGKFDFSEEGYIDGVKFIPAIGLFIGLMQGLIYYLLRNQEFWYRGIAITVFYLVITGGLHFDGLSDTFDGLLSYRDKETTLEIMKDSRIGAFGAISLIGAIVIYTFLWGYVGIGAVIVLPCISRCCMLYGASISNYARKNGMGGLLINSMTKKKGITILAIYTIIIGIISYITYGSRDFLFVLFGMVILISITTILTNNIKSRLDGITGDVLGFIIEMIQIIGLLIFYWL